MAREAVAKLNKRQFFSVRVKHRHLLHFSIEEIIKIPTEKTHPGNKKEIEKVYKNKKAGTFLRSSLWNNSASPHENLQIVVTYSSLCCPAPFLVSYQPLFFFFPEAL